MSHKIEIDEYVERAEKIAAENGGYLPNMSKLWDEKQVGLIRAIHMDRAPFEHLLPKMGRGRDKNKYAYVQANMNEDDETLAKDLDVSKTTIRNWKQEIRESGFRPPQSVDAPDDATLSAVSKFIVKNLPKDWGLNLEYGQGGCFVVLIQPNGMPSGVDDACGATLVQSILAHVNYARLKSNLPPVGWPD